MDARHRLEQKESVIEGRNTPIEGTVMRRTPTCSHLRLTLPMPCLRSIPLYSPAQVLARRIVEAPARTAQNSGTSLSPSFDVEPSCGALIAVMRAW